jgi:hypothetical protein
MSLRTYELPAAGVATAQSTSPPKRVQGSFLKGPVPMDWIARAAALSGKSLHLGVALWFRAGLVSSMTFKLSNGDLAALGVARDAKYEGLERLRRAGLIAVVQRPGCAPTVTIRLLANPPCMQGLSSTP